ncbi:HlyD family type I secretion periplasmic adaptor subunit [Defluviimonas sp. D31]|uniref:HlyD family type I secretion periplasmic adaptor subunit n=1 Tax=Defluviimonas sp. D31 TaxID=3083253 RepID=UPI00296E6D5E|nr:HlyD family type I secretion periplasmic adaptor subunit [Defluviimonas sp. D31]MDW4548900.1 HlyD family type I secretion periplasmic adaptor subunit [Defluviimonas sp. D31]
MGTQLVVPQNPNYHAEEWYSDVPRSVSRHTIIGIVLMVVAIGGFGIWALTAPLAAAVIAQGSFVATGHNKIIQHLEGGIIEEILVAEGDTVVKGQPLIHLEQTAALANQRELMLRRARLEAVNARLMSEFNGAERITFPSFLVDKGQDPEIIEIMDNQRLNFETSRTKLESDVILLKTNISALDSRVIGYATHEDALRRQHVLLEEDFLAKSGLLEQGLIRKTEVNSIERAMIDAEGQLGRLSADLAETLSLKEKYQQQIDVTYNEYRQAALDEMQAIQAELDSVREQSYNAVDVLRRSVISAPVSGTVVRMHYFTSGGVIEGGKAIAEILPKNAPLIIEAQVPRNDIDDVRLGQTATVRLVSLNQRTTPVLKGEVYYVSADSLPVDASNNLREVYLARVNLPASELERVHGFTPTPGMPAEIMIETAERTFFQYLVKPIVDSMSRAFREQ